MNNLKILAAGFSEFQRVQINSGIKTAFFAVYSYKYY